MLINPNLPQNFSIVLAMSGCHSLEVLGSATRPTPRNLTWPTGMDGLWLDISDMELVDMGEPLDFLGIKKSSAYW